MRTTTLKRVHWVSKKHKSNCRTTYITDIQHVIVLGVILDVIDNVNLGENVIRYTPM